MKRKQVMAVLFLFAAAVMADSVSICADDYAYYDESDDEEEEDDEDEEEEDDGEEETVDDEADEEETYYVYFDENGGDMATPTWVMEVVAGEKYGKLPAVKRTGFKFMGWYTKTKGGTKITEDTICRLTDDQTLHAQWQSTGGFLINYVMDGGINHKDNPDEYKKTTKTIVLKDPAKTDYTFGGWYADKKYKESVTQIKKGSIGDITLYAKWLDNPLISKISTNKNKITLTWNKCSGALKYKVYQSTKIGGAYKACATVTANTATIPNVSYNKQYFYRVSAVYAVNGRNVTTEASPVVSAICQKKPAGGGSSTGGGSSAGGGSSTGGGSGTGGGNGQAANVSGKMVFYYQQGPWNMPPEKKGVSCFCCSPAMIIHALGYECDPSIMYQVLGNSVFYNPTKITKKYGVKIARHSLLGKTEAAKKQEIYGYLMNRPQGIMLRDEDKPHTVVAYAKDGAIKINDPALAKGECIDIGKSQLKNFKNVEYIITVDK